MAQPSRCDASDLCFELSGGQQTAYAHAYGPSRPDRILDGTSRFVLLADMSPLLVGHCLLVPRSHHLNFGAVAASEPTLETYFHAIATRYESVFGNIAVIEHGSSSDMRGSACISHAHLHFFPMHIAPIIRQMTGDGLRCDPALRWEDMVASSERDEPYFMVCSKEDSFIAHAATALPKQYLRKVVARILQTEEALSDWAIIPHPEYLHETIKLWNEGIQNDDNETSR